MICEGVCMFDPSLFSLRGIFRMQSLDWEGKEGKVNKKKRSYHSTENMSLTKIIYVLELHITDTITLISVDARKNGYQLKIKMGIK